MSTPSHWYPKGEPNPIKINPDGSQSPNPRYQGPNFYKKGADGKLTLIEESPKTRGGSGWMRTLAQALGLYGAEALAKSAGTPGSARMSEFGLGPTGTGSDAPVYQTPFNNVKPQRGNTREMVDIRGSVTPGSSEAAATNLGEGIQMQIAGRHRTGAGFPEGVVRPEYYPVLSGGTAPKETETPTPTPTPEIASTSSSPDSQIPRMTFEDANKGLSDGITIQNPFADVYKTINFDASNSAPDAGDSVSGYSNNNGGFVVNPGEKSNDINDPSTWTDSYKLRRAFLDADDSLQGLRNVEALKGIKYAEGKHYRANEQAGNEGQSDFVPIDKSDYKKYKRGDLDAGSFVSELSPWSQQLVENLSTGNFTNPDNLKNLDIFKSDSEVPYNFDNVPTEVFSKKGLDLKYPGIFNSTYRPVI